MTSDKSAYTDDALERSWFAYLYLAGVEQDHFPFVLEEYGWSSVEHSGTSLDSQN